MLPKGWKLLPVGRVLVDSQYGTNAVSVDVGNTAVVGMKDIQEGKVLTANLVFANFSGKERTKYLLAKGDILINRTNSFDLVGKVGIYDSDIKAAFASYLVRLKVDITQAVPEYLNYWLNGYIAQKTIKRIATKAISQANVNPTEFKKHCYVLLPPIHEQREIVSVLKANDNAIEKTECLIAAKQKQFDWLRNRIFSDVEDAYEPIQLGAIAKIADKQKLASVKGRALLTVRLHCLGIEANTRTTPQVTERGRPYYERIAGEFVIGRQNFHNGGFGIVPQHLDGFIASNAITSLAVDADKLAVNYLFFYMSRKNYYLRVGHVMDGTGQKELSDKQILKLKICVPTLEKQRKIADVLNMAKKEITLLEKLAGEYRLQKRGLMQKLLTGEWQVNTAKEVA
jgi:type I restriction enzyme S subunit